MATITKWWTLTLLESKPKKFLCCECRPAKLLRNEPNAYVIDIINGSQLDANEKTALIGATLLIEFTYYLPQIISEGD